MNKPAYNEKQMEAYNMLHSVGKDGVSQETIDEVINMLEDHRVESLELDNSKQNDENFIKLKMMEETDWRKKAILAAMLISKSLE